MIDETVEEIRAMQTHSSSVVAIRATRALRELLDREFATVEEYHRALEQNGTVLRRANPSHASLQNAIRGVVSAVEDAQPATVEEAKTLTETHIEAVVTRIESAKRRAGENAVGIIEDGDTLLTHDYSSTVLEALVHATEQGKHVDVFVTEARPRYIGRRTARELAPIDSVDVTLITDSASGYYLAEVDRVLLGMSCIVEDTLYNRVGTFPIVSTASRLGVPVTVVGSAAKIITDGFVFENEFRSPSEVLLEPSVGFTVANPAYDATPVSLLEGVITEDGNRPV
ncbi:MAG: translation initiation factor eIF-2B [Halobacteriota archaeon]